MSYQKPPTPYTPEVWADPIARQLLLRGTCFPEDSVAFFQPLRAHFLSNLAEYQKGPLHIFIELSYINSSAQRELYQMIGELLQNGVQVKLIIYQGEEEELDDLRHVVAALEALGLRDVEYREGIHSSASVTEEAPPSER